MCLIAFAYRQHPDFPLILLANRDEFHQRPCDPMHWWSDAPILAGRDRQAGGTWLGVDRRGRFAAVTNYREKPLHQAARSRGEIPVAFLSGNSTAPEFAERLAERQPDYAGFNLLLYDGRDCIFASNRRQAPVPLQPGFHGISNGGLDDEWPKVVRTRGALAGLLDAGRETEEAALLALLTDRRPAGADQLPRTGLDVGVERFLSAPFICSEDYGTRASTLLWIGQGQARLVEYRHGPAGVPQGRSEFGVSDPC